MYFSGAVLCCIAAHLCFVCKEATHVQELSWQKGNRPSEHRRHRKFEQRPPRKLGLMCLAFSLFLRTLEQLSPVSHSFNAFLQVTVWINFSCYCSWDLYALYMNLATEYKKDMQLTLGIKLHRFKYLQVLVTWAGLPVGPFPISHFPRLELNWDSSRKWTNYHTFIFDVVTGGSRFQAYPHQRQINSSTNWANDLVWSRPQKHFSSSWTNCKFSVDSSIGNSALVQFSSSTNS